MPSRESAARLGPRKPFGLRDRAPAAWSVALHAALLAAAAFVPWSQRQSAAPPRMEVVWVREWPQTQSPRRPEEPQRQEPRPQPQPPQSEELRPKEPPPQTLQPEELQPEEPSPEITPNRSAEPEPNAPSAERQSNAPSTEQASNAPSTGHAPTPRRADIDWDAERRLAIKQITRELERENRFPTFSFNDIVPKSPPKDDDPLEHLFDGGGGGPPAGRSVLGVGQARTKVGRFLSNLCNALTGGVSVFGVMSLCARDTTEPYSASPLRPEYLKKLPVCEDTAVAAAPMQANDTLAAAATAEDPSTAAPIDANDDSARPSPSAASTIKCRLLTEAERAEYWKNAAERLRREEFVTAPEQDASREERIVPRR